MLVVDASVLAPIVADGGPDGEAYRARIAGEQLAAPGLVHIEVLSVLRRQLSTGTLTEKQAGAALDDLIDLPLSLYPVEIGLRRAWALRANVSPYDATYVTLAETLGCPLLTADGRLARSPGPTCAIEVL